MRLRDGLVAARGHLVFIAALLCSFALIFWLDRGAGGLRTDAAIQTTDRVVATAAALPVRPLSESDPEQLQWARVAWRYFENNTDPATGLANAADNYHSTTMWDTGSYLIGLVSAHRLGLVDATEFDRRVTAAASSLARLALFDGLLPNKAYDTSSLAMTDYNNKASERGIGWSALDIARLVVALEAISTAYPGHAGEIAEAMSRWQLDALVDDGELVGAAVDLSGATVLVQEGRTGYEEYGAKALMLLGLDAVKAVQVERHVVYHEVEALEIAVDSRLIGNASPGFATSEPYMLDGLEFGFDSVSQVLASNIYRAQKSRFATTGHLTAVSEGQLSREPTSPTRLCGAVVRPGR
ncbi:MAG: hypothetical protein JWQ89_2731 [Devosia sp.]|nr:hypothetical protein [Devosia sp.]